MLLCGYYLPTWMESADGGSTGETVCAGGFAALVPLSPVVAEMMRLDMVRPISLLGWAYLANIVIIYHSELTTFDGFR